MNMLNALEPTPEQLKAFLASSETGKPVFMLNLLKFKNKATYKDGEAISGRAAYTRYAKALTQMVEGQEGFGVVFGGNMNTWMIGQGEGDWDAVAIVTYPDAQTMFETVSSEAYRKIHKHRRAGLAGQLLISCDNEGLF